MFDFNFYKKIKINFIPFKEKKWLLPLVLATVLLLFSFFFFLFSFQYYFSNKFFIGSSIGGINLTGLTINEAQAVLQDKIYEIDNQSLKIKYLNEDNKEEISFLTLSLNTEHVQEFFNYESYSTIEENFKIGRSENIFINFKDQFLLMIGYLKLKNNYEINYDLILESIKKEVGHLEKNHINAHPEIICSGKCLIDIKVEQFGKSFNYQEAIEKWSFGLNDFKNDLIILEKIEKEPEIKKEEISFLIKDLENLFSDEFKDIEFVYQNDIFKLNKKTFSTMIIFNKENNQIKLNIDKDKFLKWFDNFIASKINIEAKNALIEIKNGRVTSLLTHKNGKEADFEVAFNSLNNKISNNNFSDLRFELIIKDVYPEVKTEDVNNLGIKEVLGTGESNFAGSSANRIKNIRVGANKLHGLLIKPDEEFSLVKALLPFDASAGYVQELVIKDNRTIPEYGGGLCQIGTTMFRTTMSTGLPVLERRNHSFSVSYYLEDGLPGTDATIYDPKPDFRFKNDTGNYILIQSRIEGSKIYFDFWGTSDGRKAERTKVRTWGVRPPPPSKIIVSNDLKPGERKCTEKPAKGISTAFDYIVTYPDQEPIKTTFTSVYRPWQEVCLVGPQAQVEEKVVDEVKEEVVEE